jgi:hypothetical protein
VADKKMEFAADLIKELSNLRALDHLDGYGGALFALDVYEAVKKTTENEWKLERR